MASEEGLFANVAALLEEEPQLPSLAERARLREAAGITQARLAQALKSTVQSVKNYENGRSEPKSPRLEAYQRLLNGWTAKYPAPSTASTATPQPAPVPGTCTSPAAPEATEAESAAPVEASAAQVAPKPPAACPAASSRCPAAKKAAKPALDARFPHGPLAVLDGDVTAYGTGGIVLDCPARTVPELPLVRKRRQRQAVVTGGITVETRARFGYTAAPGTTDDGRFRRLAGHLPTPAACSTPGTPEWLTGTCARSSRKASATSTCRTAEAAPRASRTSPSTTSTTSTSTSEPTLRAAL
ncbi:Helix-turn-helix protein [Streptomyces sp. ADI96-02]|nr:Helix-turn-helix protein [Streptomyces sp. ADI96-02]